MWGIVPYAHFYLKNKTVIHCHTNKLSPYALFHFKNIICICHTMSYLYKVKTERLNLRVTPELKAEVEKLALSNDCSVSKYVAWAVIDKINRDKEAKQSEDDEWLNGQ